MSGNDFFNTARSNFSIIGPSISKEIINEVFAGAFPGKDDLVEFYLRHNGGCRSERGCLVHCGNHAHRSTRENIEKIRIEGFFAILPSPEEKSLKYRSLTKYLASRARTFSEIPEMKLFFGKHRPIASDHTGNDCWIDLQSGYIQYVLWDSWREGPVTIAHSFHEFVDKFWNVTAVDPDSVNT